MATKQTNSGHSSATVKDTEYDRAVEAGRDAARARSVRFDRASKRLHIELQDGTAILIPTQFIQGLRKASADDIESFQLLADGYALHWPALDVDITVPGLLSGLYGTQQWMREFKSTFLSEAGRKGGKATTPRKRLAARANGKLGGRPRKKVTH